MKSTRLFFWSFAVALAVGGLVLPQATRDRAAEALRLNNLGVATMNQQRFEDGLKLFEQAYASNRDLSTARVNQGIALFNLQRLDSAREILLEVTRQHPQSVRAWYNLGLVHKTAGQAEPAVEAFRRVSELDPNDADTHYFVGLMQSQLQQHEPAITAYQRALELAPFHVSAEFGLARSYQRLGNAEEARRHLARFQQLTQEKIGTPMSLAYGDQGKYSMAEPVIARLGAAPPATRVRFVSAAAQAGLRFEHKAASETQARTVAPFLGPGACFLDYDADRRPDLFVLNGASESAGALYRNTGEGRFVDVTNAARLNVRGQGMGCTAGDYDNDGRTDLAVSFSNGVALFRNKAGGTFENVTEGAGVRTADFPLGLTFVDYDHDGDLDLYVARFVNFPLEDASKPFAFPPDASSPGNVLWRNNGNGTFVDWTSQTSLKLAGPSVAAVSTDFNNDRAIDLLVTGWRNSPSILVNPREGAFRPIEPWASPMPGPTAGAAVLDFNKDGWMDFAFTHWGSPGLSLWQSIEGKRFERVSLTGTDWTRGWGLVVLDYDNDGWLDLAAAGEAAAGAQIRLLRNRGTEGFEDVTSAVELSTASLNHPRALIAADYDSDGDADLFVTQNGGPIVLLRNDGGNQNAWLRADLRGLNDNKSAIGTKVEIFAGAQWQKWEVQAASGYLGQSASEVIAGLGSNTEVDIIRMLWPTGVLQDELQLAARKSHTVIEIDRRGSSCPVLFAWNGSRYEFFTDVIGAGIVGHWVGPGERNISDPTEYVKVEGKYVQPRQGRLSFRFMEPMEELVYLDQVRLLAVDHPANADVYPNEYFAGSPPFPDFKVIVSSGARPPRGAWDDSKRDVLPDLLHRDRRYVAGFDSLQFRGFAKLHSLELDLGEMDPSRPLRLLLHGFTDYFSATSVFAAYQAQVQPVVPYVEALDKSGRWVRVADNMGFPAGLVRTMVADLTGRLPAGTRRIRILTNLKIYWDQILVDTTSESIAVQLIEVPLAEATLRFRGYPRQVEGNPTSDVSYVYEEVSQTGPYARHIGSYTNYGDVRSLLTAAEDQFAIFGSGEEVALEFDPASLPPLPSGWTRDYFFFADGFAKDMDFYEAYSQTVEPLPFHQMSRYPYPTIKGYPASGPYLTYRLNHNTRLESGKGMHVFRFQYRTQSNQ